MNLQEIIKKLEEEVEKKFPYISNREGLKAVVDSKRKIHIEARLLSVQAIADILKHIGKKNWYVNEDGTVWEDAYTGLPSTREVPLSELLEGFMPPLVDLEKLLREAIEWGYNYAGNPSTKTTEDFQQYISSQLQSLK